MHCLNPRRVPFGISGGVPAHLLPNLSPFFGALNWERFFHQNFQKVSNDNEDTFRHTHTVDLSDASRLTPPFARFFSFLNRPRGGGFEEGRFEREIAVMQTPLHYQTATRKATNLPHFRFVSQMNVVRVRPSFIS